MEGRILAKRPAFCGEYMKNCKECEGKIVVKRNRFFCSKRCRNKRLNIRHGFSKTRFHHIWLGIRHRCNQKSEKYRKYYLNKGIKCIWKSFEEFRDDMYDSYLIHIKRFGKKNTSIDRIDNNGNYCRENCRWATPKEQVFNSSHVKWIEFLGEKRSQRYWSKHFSISQATIIRRLKMGWTLERVFLTPTLDRGRKIYWFNSREFHS